MKPALDGEFGPALPIRVFRLATTFGGGARAEDVQVRHLSKSANTVCRGMNNSWV